MDVVREREGIQRGEQDFIEWKGGGDWVGTWVLLRVRKGMLRGKMDVGEGNEGGVECC